jgi:hypothetical protein
MNLNEWVFWIGTIIVIAGAVISWTHIIIYSAKSKWQLYEEGWALMWTIGSYALVLTYVALANMQSVVNGIPASALRDYPQRGLLRIAIFGLSLFVLSRWLILLLRNQRRTEES